MPDKARQKSSSKGKAACRADDAIALLRAGHAVVQDLFDQFEKERKAERKQILAARICMELTIHAMIEEEIFYPAAREALPKDDDLFDEAEVEHNFVKEFVAKIISGKPSDERWEATVIALGSTSSITSKKSRRKYSPRFVTQSLILGRLVSSLLSAKNSFRDCSEREITRDWVVRRFRDRLRVTSFLLASSFSLAEAEGGRIDEEPLVITSNICWIPGQERALQRR